MFSCINRYCMTTNSEPTNFDEDIILNSFTKENSNLMSLDGNTYKAKVVYIYDGDTMHVVFKEFGNYYRWNCRITGVDTPELRTKNKKEKEYGYKVRDILREKLMDKIVEINTFEFDKYGRLLIDVIMPEQENNEKITLSKWLINNKYAYEYNGGTKNSWDSIDLNSE